MIYISICITLLTMVAVLYFYAKAEKDQVTGFIKKAYYFIIITCVVALVFQFGHGAMAMAHRYNKGNYKAFKHHHGKQHDGHNWHFRKHHKHENHDGRKGFKSNDEGPNDSMRGNNAPIK